LIRRVRFLPLSLFWTFSLFPARGGDRRSSFFSLPSVPFPSPLPETARGRAALRRASPSFSSIFFPPPLSQQSLSLFKRAAFLISATTSFTLPLPDHDRPEEESIIERLSSSLPSVIPFPPFLPWPILRHIVASRILSPFSLSLPLLGPASRHGAQKRKAELLTGLPPFFFPLCSPSTPFFKYS